jgi:hypothetical protein
MPAFLSCLGWANNAKLGVTGLVVFDGVKRNPYAPLGDFVCWAQVDDCLALVFVYRVMLPGIEYMYRYN